VSKNVADKVGNGHRKFGDRGDDVSSFVGRFILLMKSMQFGRE
jgi:hypothetical protein